MKLELLIKQSLQVWQEQEAQAPAAAEVKHQPLTDPFYQALEQRLQTDLATYLEHKHRSFTFHLEALKDRMRQSRDQRKGISWNSLQIPLTEPEPKPELKAGKSPDAKSSKKKAKGPQQQEVLIRDARKAVTDVSAVDSDHTYWYQSYVVKGLSYLHAAINTLYDFKLLAATTQAQLLNIFKHFYFLAKSYDGSERVADLIPELEMSLRHCLSKAAANNRPLLKTALLLAKYAEYRVSLPSKVKRYPIITVGKSKKAGEYEAQEYFDARIPGLVDEQGRYKVNMTSDTTVRGSLRNYYLMATGTTRKQRVRVTHIQGHSACFNDAHVASGLFGIPPVASDTAADHIAEQLRHSHSQVVKSKKAPVRVGVVTLITDSVREDRKSWQIKQSTTKVLHRLQTDFLSPLAYSNRPIDVEKNIFVGVDENLGQAVLKILSSPIGLGESKHLSKKLAFLTDPTASLTQASYDQACGYIKAMSPSPQQDNEAKIKAQKRLFAAATLYRAIHCNELFQQGKMGSIQFPIRTFLEADPQAASCPARQLHLGALECIMWYNLGGQAALDKHLSHVTCKSGQRRTQLLLLQMKVMLRFYEVNQYSYLPDPTAANYQDQKAIFADICKRAIAEDVEATVVDRGSMNGNFSLHPSSISAFPGYMDREQLKKQVYLHLNPDGAPAKSPAKFKLGDESFNIDKVNLAQYEVKILEQLQKITISAIERYLQWFTDKFHHHYGYKLHLAKHERPPTEGLLGKLWATGNVTHGLNGYYNAQDLLATVKGWKTLNIACLSIRTYLKDSGIADHSLSEFIRRELQIKENRSVAKFLLGDELVQQLPVLTLTEAQQQNKKTDLVAIEQQKIKAGQGNSSMWPNLFKHRERGIRNRLTQLDPRNLKLAPDIATAPVIAAAPEVKH